MMNRLLLILLLSPIIISAQDTKSILIKTLPIQDIFYQNPNVTVEWKYNSKFSVGIAAALRNGAWYQTGGEGPPFPDFKTSSGYSLGLSGRLYIPNRSGKESKWFTALLIRYNNTLINNAKLNGCVHGCSRFVNLTRKGPEIGTTFGRQFIINYISIELYLGLGTQLQYYSEDYISGDITYLEKDYTSFIPRFYMGFSLGFDLTKLIGK